VALGLLTALAGPLSHAQETLAVDAAKDETGFTPLFNGKDLDGWTIHGNRSGWSVQPGGILRNDASKGNFNWIRYSRKTFTDFILKLEWRVAPDGNSGVFLRARENGPPWTTGVEVQISNAPRDASHCTGSLYGLAAVEPRPDERAEIWHSYEIHCIGKRYKVIADGVTCVDSNDRHTALMARPLEGYIGLQDAHQKAPSFIEYRNIRIKEHNQ
jgi:hypothetical protein